MPIHTSLALLHTPILAPGSAQHAIPPTSLTPLQHTYDSLQPHIPPLVPTPLNSLGTQTPLAPPGQPGPTSYGTDHLLLGNAFQPMHNAHANTSYPIHMGNMSNLSNIPTSADVQIISGGGNFNNNAGQGMGPVYGPNSMPPLNSFLQGNTYRRQMPDSNPDPTNFGTLPYPAPVQHPYTQMMHGQGLGMQNFPQETSQPYAGYNLPLGPLPGRANAFPTVPNGFYHMAQPHLQQFRYPLEDRSYSENLRPLDDFYPNAARNKPPTSYSDEYGNTSGYHIGPIQPAPNNPNVPLLPSLIKQQDALRPSLSLLLNDPNSSRMNYQSYPGIQVNSTIGVNDVDVQINFKPPETKQNKRPKINKLANDLTEFKTVSQKKKKVVVEEASFDETYAHFQEVLGIQNPRIDIKKRYEVMLQTPLERYLFDFFVHRIALFIDTFLVHEFFQIIVPELALYDETRMILDSMLCLSSLISQRMNPLSVDALCPYDYYQKCVYSVGKNVALDKSKDPDGKILARCLISTNLLCIYEMFFVAVDSVYVKGAGGIFATIMSKPDKPAGILKVSPFYYSCFWATIVCDLILSLKLEYPCTFSVEWMWKSLDPTYDEYESYEAFLLDKTDIKDAVSDQSSFIVTNEKTTWWLHKITLLLILVNDFHNHNDVISYEDFMGNKRFLKWLQLKEKLDEFEKRMPLYLKPLIFMPATTKDEFPKIFFKDEKTVVAAINFRLAKLLIYAALKEKLRVFDSSLVEKELQNYSRDYSENLAREVAGIMKTYDADMRIWPINIHSLRQASRFIEPSSPCFETLKNLTAKVILTCQTKLNILELLMDKSAGSKTGSERSFVEA